VDEGGKKVSVQTSYRHPQALLSKAMGNFQTMANGNVLLGWGDLGIASEFAPDGRWLSDTKFGNRHDTYRAYRYPWSGKPLDEPAVATRRAGDGTSRLYVSWNGATSVSGWIVSTGRRSGSLRPVGIARRRGFETVIPMSSASGLARVTAVDAAGRKLGTSRVVRVG
jgi:hypothetical protein